jgi:hypothetical protein
VGQSIRIISYVKEADMRGEGKIVLVTGARGDALA